MNFIPSLNDHILLNDEHVDGIIDGVRVVYNIA